MRKKYFVSFAILTKAGETTYGSVGVTMPKISNSKDLARLKKEFLEDNPDYANAEILNWKELEQ